MSFARAPVDAPYALQEDHVIEHRVLEAAVANRGRAREQALATRALGWAWRQGVALALLLALVCAGRARAQSSAQAPGEQLEVYLMTMGPGDQVWERFGHNAVGIRNRKTGADVVYNWGVFDFRQTDFLPRFLRGEMRYSVEAYDARAVIAFYRDINRSVSVQELALTPAQRVALKEFVEWNALEANKHYRYDYFVDNCSTRARDALDKALGGVLRRQFAGSGSGRSFRDEARRLADADVLYTGIDIGLGAPSDREMTRHEALFIPMRLQEALREVQVPDSNGGTRPLVASERELFRAARPAELSAPENHQGRYALIGLALTCGLALAARFSPRAERVAAAAWCGLAGLFGMLLVLLWGFTQHTWAYQNMNLLYFNPLWWGLAWVVWRRGALGPRARAFVGVVAGLALLGVVLGLLRTPQHSEQVALLVAWPHAWVLARRWRAK
ncbi:MAG: DUF4105 domain-containing protein [Planctomycetes bacterium]|nr:DUF4105 domain-containing protein [Planctomycetota bacterium]